MCPDKQVLSAYVDGEVSGKYEQIILDHCNDCEECTETLHFYRSLKENLVQISTPDIPLSQARVYDRIKAEIREEEKHRQKIFSLRDFWRESISLPAPMVAFSTILFFVLLGGFIVSLNISKTTGIASLGPSTPSRVEIDAGSLEELSKYFEAESISIQIKMKLPEDSHFEIVGEPQFLREADFHKSVDNFNKR